MFNVFSAIKIYLLIIVIIGISLPVEAKEITLGLSAGHRVDSLDWNIAADFSGTTPNVLSELNWDDLQSFQVATEAEIFLPLRPRTSTVFVGRAAYGWILSGRNQDSDYAGDSRTREWSRSNNDASDGHVLDLEGGVGVRYILHDGQWKLTPYVGYSYFEQNLVMQEGYQTISDPGNAPPPFVPISIGPIPGLDSSYFAWWFGPWLGIKAEYQYNDRFQWDASLRWYEIEYRAEANWNLRNDLQHPVSFEHEADGDGLSLNIGMDYLLQEKWSLLLDMKFIDLQGDDGLDIVYFSDGTVGGTRLNEVNWDSWAVSCGVTYKF